jgi:hypothetical protein
LRWTALGEAAERMRTVSLLGLQVGPARAVAGASTRPQKISAVFCKAVGPIEEK